MTNNIELVERSRKLLEGITPGPWAMHPVVAQVDAFDGKGAAPLPVCQMLWPTDLRSEDQTEANAQFIAAAPTIIAEAADELIRLNEMVRVLGEALRGARRGFQAAQGLISAMSGRDSICIENNIEHIDTALSLLDGRHD